MPFLDSLLDLVFFFGLVDAIFLFHTAFMVGRLWIAFCLGSFSSSKWRPGEYRSGTRHLAQGCPRPQGETTFPFHSPFNCPGLYNPEMRLGDEQGNLFPSHLGLKLQGQKISPILFVAQPSTPSRRPHENFSLEPTSIQVYTYLYCPLSDRNFLGISGTFRYLAEGLESPPCNHSS